MTTVTREFSVRSKQCRLIAAAVVAAGWALAGSPASAQTTRQIDVSGGYLNVMGSMHGGNAQVDVELSRRWSFVGEFDWSRGRDCTGCDPAYTDVAGLVGARFRWLRDGRISPFLQVLAGKLQSTAGDYQVELCCGLGGRMEEGFTMGYVALQSAGGMTAMITRRVGVIAQVDVQFAIPDDSQYYGMSIFPRVVTGAVIRLGGAK